MVLRSVTYGSAAEERDFPTWPKVWAGQELGRRQGAAPEIIHGTETLAGEQSWGIEDGPGPL